MPWIVREFAKDDGELLREIDVDEQLTFVLANLLGESPDDMIGAVFPLDKARFAHIKELFGLDPEWDDAEWCVEAMVKNSSGS